ncbi:MAG: UDP-N-acetylglucosamine 2-epimerase (non-hydrolyzing) [Pseudomonadota bacterium]
MRRILSVVGARPQFVKAGPLSRAIAGSAQLSELLVHTGQHFDEKMSDVFFTDLGIPEPHHNLNISGGTHGRMTGQMLEALEQVMCEEQPDMVLVYGDTNSTLAGALAASKLHIPVAHVEAGLRSFNRRMPEEINRVLTDHVSDLLFCSTYEAVAHLEREGIKRNVWHVGDIMYDACMQAKNLMHAKSNIIAELKLKPGTYSVCTVHRAENTDDVERFREVIAYLEHEASDADIVFPIHPRTRARLEDLGRVPKGLKIIAPLGYFDFHRLIADALAIYTDSGGLQKEAYFHGVPCVTLREETEWSETISNGWNRLWRQPSYKTPRADIGEYGAGDTAERIVEHIESHFLS